MDGWMDGWVYVRWNSLSLSCLHAIQSYPSDLSITIKCFFKTPYLMLTLWLMFI
jgi:hypothetical protein